MIINEEVKAAITGSAFIPLVTINADGMPHPIIAGKGEVVNDTVVFGIYKMEQTQKNLLTSNAAWIMSATMQGKPIGYRLTGTAEAKGKQLIFTATKVEPMI